MSITDIFSLHSNGVKTNRDDIVYNFHRDILIQRVKHFVEDFNAEIDRYARAGKPKDIDSFVHYERIQWSRDLKLDLRRGIYANYADTKVRVASYRPFTKLFLF